MLVDYSTAKPTIAQLKNAGVTGVGRYIGWDSVKGFPSIGKNIQKDEAQTLEKAGIEIFLAFEYAPGAALRGFDQGVKDAELAVRQLDELGAPEDMGVYFAVDIDARDYAPGLPDDPQHALAKLGPIGRYFQGIHSVHPKFSTDGYGGYYVIHRLFNAGLIKHGWQTVGWSGGHLDPRVQIYQVMTKVPILGADDDIREHEATQPDYGQWPRPKNPATKLVEHVTVGQKSLVGLAAEPDHAERPGRIIRDTALHATQEQWDKFADYLELLLTNPILPDVEMDKGTHVWVLQRG